MDNTDGTESRLQKLCEEGQWREAFDLAYQAYYPEIAGFCVTRLAKIVNDPVADGEEIAQQVFLEFFRRLGQGEFRGDRSSVRTSLFLLVRRRCIDRVRAAQRNAARHGTEISQTDRAPKQRLPEEALLNEEWLRLLHTHIEALRDIDRDIVVLRYYHGFSDAEIAGIVGLLPGNVRARRRRAFRILREGLLGDK
jgi:RNA polymerase sigma-70 factor (ECF subfamily)